MESATQDKYCLILDEGQSALFDPAHQQAIAASLSEYHNRAVAVDIRIAAVDTETPAARRRREKSEAIAAIHQSFYQDDGVQALLSRFDARIEAESLEITR